MNDEESEGVPEDDHSLEEAKRRLRDAAKLKAAIPDMKQAADMLRTFENTRKRLDSWGVDLKQVSEQARLASLPNSLIRRDLEAAQKISDSYRQTLSGNSSGLKGVSDALMKSDIAKFGRLAESIRSEQRTIGSGISEIMKQISATGQMLEAASASKAFASDVAKITQSVAATYAQLHAAARPMTQILDDFRKHAENWSKAHATITSALAASLLIATTPLPQVGKSTMDLAALAAAALNAGPDRETWAAAREESFLVDGISMLYEAERPTNEEPLDVDAIVDAISTRISADLAKNASPSRILSHWAVATTLLFLLLAAVPIYQTERNRMEDAAKHDYNSDIARILESQDSKLDRIVTLLSDEAAKIPKVVGLRTANIRQAPTTKSKTVGTLKAGDIAVFDSTSAGWVLIEIADPLSKEVTRGWVYSQFVSKID
jgi:hypothetical protein